MASVGLKGDSSVKVQGSVETICCVPFCASCLILSLLILARSASKFPYDKCKCMLLNNSVKDCFHREGTSHHFDLDAPLPLSSYTTVLH